MVNGLRALSPLPLTSLNHISLVCKSVEESMEFYENILGFVPIKRPGSFDFDGAWLFNYGIGIHLIRCRDSDDLPKKSEINPLDNHISFQCESMQAVERRLEELKIKYVKRRVEEGGVNVDQMFMHDPDGFMIEICNCDNLPVVPLGSSACMRVPSTTKMGNSNSNKKERETPLLKFDPSPDIHEGFAMCG